MTPLAPTRREGGDAPSVRQLLDAQAITTHFQPIFSVRQKSVVGMEALSRGVGTDGRIIPPARLFADAALERLSAELEDRCRRTAVRTFAALEGRPDELLLFLNLDFAGACNPDSLPGELTSMVRASNLLPRNVALEFLESRLEDVARFGALARNLRQQGFLVVLDDVGAGHSNLDRIPLFRPDIIKIDRGLISGVARDFYKQETLKSLVSLSRRIGALVVAEGIESEAEAIVALELGVDLLQGFFLGRPQAATAFVDDLRAGAGAGLEALALNFKNHMVAEINGRKSQHREFNVIQDRLLRDLTKVRADDFDAVLSAAIGAFPQVECLYVLDDTGSQVTETIRNDGVARARNPVIFRPAPRGTDHSLKEYFYVLIDLELRRYTTDPYVSLASGNLCRTISTGFRDATNDRLYVLCLDIGSPTASARAFLDAS
ncbi:MAG TPA: EAL domain-containing protein [Polyangia bacterium]|nr:EAL domain-containing protein [Polyangia bacterium]